MAKKKQSARVKKAGRTRSSKKSSELTFGIKIISVIYFLAAALWVLLGLLIMIGPNEAVTYLVTTFPALETMMSYGLLVALSIIVGAIVMIIGLLIFLTGQGLWKLKPWAKITAIVFSSLGVISAIESMITGFRAELIIALAIHVAIIVYLVFFKEAKEAFKK
jgi:amino acid transporter